MSAEQPTAIPEFAALTDIGRARSDNQDQVAAQELAGGRGFLLVVCDGMGGHAGGAMASGLAVRAVVDAVSSASQAADEALLCRALEEANGLIWRTAEANLRVKGMGTTCVAALLRGSTLTVAHVGDSRAYLLDRGVARALTEDHTLSGEITRSGLTVSDVDANNARHILTRCLGGEPKVRVDLHQCAMPPGGVVLLCSDGLTAYVGDHELTEICAGRTPSESVRMLVDLANERGGGDNISVVALRATGAAHAGAAGPAARPAAPRRGWAIAKAAILVLFLGAGLIFLLLWFFFPCC